MNSFIRLLCLVTVGLFMTTAFQSCDKDENDDDDIKQEEVKPTIEIVFEGLGTQNIDDNFGSGSIEGILFCPFNFVINPPIKNIKGKLYFKDSVPFEYCGDLEEKNFGYNCGYDSATGKFVYADKWYFKNRVSGENALKVVFDLDNGNSIESDWVYFRYDWTNGITLIK